MRIAVTGSIATDHLMSFSGKFADQFVADKLENVSLSFLVEDLEIRRGGVAANISFALGRMGLTPILVGAVGHDFDDYRSWLERHGVDTKSVHVSADKHTARFMCTTDETQNQLASFYAGAMSEAREIEIQAVADRVGELDLVVIAPNDPEAMLRHTEECRQRGIPFAADISQQLAIMPGEDVKKLVEGAAYLFTNEYESSLLLKHTGWSADEVLDRVGTWVSTHGGEGVRIEGRGHDTISLPAIPDVEPVEPTGVGDAFRSGFLWGISRKMTMERAAQAGCALASIVLETVGPQEYPLDRADFSDRVARAYGNDAAAEIESKLRV
ncbi:carbohydrate kinase family protein [Saccharomonospora iraqiensis]|uniref:carbohydrate kinase family protein n=1 Tax=Saccharomonospora iraqiensis TaxID=52698 RepID=UPI00022DF481|nr:carbohydrate kinase family protein [Saccharomonospora iraqiensis]